MAMLVCWTDDDSVDELLEALLCSGVAPADESLEWLLELSASVSLLGGLPPTLMVSWTTMAPPEGLSKTMGEAGTVEEAVSGAAAAAPVVEEAAAGVAVGRRLGGRPRPRGVGAGSVAVVVVAAAEAGSEAAAGVDVAAA